MPSKREAMTFITNRSSGVALVYVASSKVRETANTLSELYLLGLCPIVVMGTKGVSLTQNLAHSFHLSEEIDKINATKAYPLYSHLTLESIRRHVDNGNIPIITATIHDSARLLLEDPLKLLQKLCTDLGASDLGAPIKFIVLNETGGIETNSDHHGFINLSANYLLDAEFKNQDSTTMSNVKIISEVLKVLPSTSSAIVAAAESNSEVIANVLTEKPVQTVTSKVTVPPTMFRRGLALVTYHSFESINMARLETLLVQSFRRNLDPKYWLRLKETFLSVTIAGDYNGAVVLTKEDGLIYLDKFAVSPTSQGLGVADLLWCDLKMSKNVFWRSKKSNPVNKWYFDRCDGHLTDTYWTFFYFGTANSRYYPISTNIPASFFAE